jgi:ABC-2 type transport system permease protein
MSFFEVVKCELNLIRKDMDILLTLIAGVIIYSFFYPQPYLNQSVYDIPTAIVDLDRSKSSTELSFMIDSTAQIKVTHYLNSEDEAKKLLTTSQIKGFVVIPIGYEKRLFLSKMPTVSVGADGSYFLLMEGILSSSTEAVFAQIDEFKHQDKSSEFDIINLFNPDNSYKLYVVPAVYVLILQQMFLIGVALLTAGINEKILKKEDGYFVKESALKILSARVFIFTTLFLIYGLYYFGFALEFFDIYHLSSMLNIIILLIPYMLSVILLANVLGLLLKQREYVTPVVLMSSMPLVFTSVFVWPIQAVPDILVVLSLFFPSSPAITGFLQLNQMGASLEMIMPQYALLWLHVILYALISLYLMRKGRILSLNQEVKLS